MPISFTENSSNFSSEEVVLEAAVASKNGDSNPMKNEIQRTRRISISDLLEDHLVHEGDNWRLQHKGETFWARITGNGELEVNGSIYSNPSRAGKEVIKRPCAGWDYWFFKNKEAEWEKVESLRAICRENHGISAMRRVSSASDIETKKAA